MSRGDLDRELVALRSEIALMALAVDDILRTAFLAVRAGNAYDARQVLQREEEFENAGGKVEEKAIELLTLQQPILAGDLRFVVGSLVISQRLQRVGHNGFGIARLTIEMAGLVGEEAPTALWELADEARGMIHNATVAFVQNNQTQANEVVEREHAFDPRYHALRDQLMANLARIHQSTVLNDIELRRNTYWIWVAHKAERTADHAAVIARRVHLLQ